MTLQFLANENIPLPSITQLRLDGYDVASITERYPGITDEEVLRIAVAESRIVLTFDRDYGELIFSQAMPCPPGLVYLRITPRDPLEAAALLVTLIKRNPRDLFGHFIVLERDNFRRRPLPQKK